MTTEYYSLKKNQYSISDYVKFKRICKTLKDKIDYIQTGQSKTMYYLKVVGKQSTWKKILGKGPKFNYLPGGASNVKWSRIMVKI